MLSLFSSHPNWDSPPRQIACRRGGGESQFGRGDRHCGSLGIYVLCGTASLENLPNNVAKIRKTLRVCGRFLMCNPAIDSIAGVNMRNRENYKFDSGRTHPGIYKIKNVYSRYRLDSGITHQKSPAHSLEIKIAGDVLPLSIRLRENTLRYRIFDPGGHMIRSVHMNCCLTAQIRFMHFKGPGSFKNFF